MKIYAISEKFIDKKGSYDPIIYKWYTYSEAEAKELCEKNNKIQKDLCFYQYTELEQITKENTPEGCLL